MTRSLLYLVGGINLFAGASMLLPLLYALATGEDLVAIHAVSLAVTVVPSLVILRRVGRADLRMTPRTGIAAVAVGWITVPLFSALPFLLSGGFGGFTDSCFESVSGFTTTGSSILVEVEPVARSLLLWRSYIQWMGGMGIVLVTVAVFSFLGGGALQLYRAEVPGLKDDKLYPRIATVARTLWLTYILLTAAQVLLLLLGGVSLFDAVCHAFTTLATGGYSTHTASIAYFESPYVQWVVVVFMALAGVNFALHATALSHRGLGYLRDAEFRFYAGILLVSAALIALARWSGGPVAWSESFVRENVFSVVSILTTTGYANCDYEQWQTATHAPALILTLLMFVGGMGGSTGGGIKCIRFLLLLKLLRREAGRIMHPRAVHAVKLMGRTVPDDVLRATAVFFFAFVLLFVVASLALALLGLDAVTAVTAVASALNNIGPGFGSVGPAENFHHLPDIAKWILMVCMIAGRLEVYTLLLLGFPSFWRR
jgi:trk system potassium uptake protein TrkH